MLKKLLLATTVCIALSACNDSSSSSNTEPSDPLETLSFKELSNVSSIARVETSSEDGSHLIGFDANGAPIGDISNMGVEDFTPTSDGGFVVEVSENHKAIYKYTQGLAPIDSDSDDTSALKKLIAAVTGDKPVVDVTQTFRRPVWYYVASNGDYYLITNNKELPDFVGENSKGLLVFSNGDAFNTVKLKTGHFYNNLKLNKDSIIEAISQLSDENSDETIAEVMKNLVQNKTIEKTKSVTEMSSDSLLSSSETLGNVLIESTKGKTAHFSGDICDDLKPSYRTVCNTVVIPTINDGVVSGIIGLSNRIEDIQGDVTQILPIPDSDLTLLNNGLLNDDASLDESFINGWDGESAQDITQSYVLSSSFTGQTACQDSNKQCLYSAIKTEIGSIGNKTDTIESNFVIDANTGFETDSQAGKIEGGQQNYLWVNDSYIVIKEATQIFIIDRADNNKLLDPVLAGTEIDTINLTDDNKLYITDTMSNDISNGEKLHALKALIK
ncbi:hypothetical protein [Vibrio sp. CK2-1]|uniref:hypothetical protein n=1 Tax=Vibrio sp. CK2-1 TaxID=2912249 RepID=UPI001F2E3E37|nr:hypothetical protein [Vibrio sp. CK2-1]MCF7354969.1 hypothetical protein [Vibrio sp. CK2-1]